jgi:cellobiose phosphorylase
MQKIYDYCNSNLDIIWDGKWFIRAFTDDGEKFCTDDDEFNKIHLIPQAWAVMSGLGDKDKLNMAMDNVMKYLYTDKGIISHYNASDRNDGVPKSYYHFTAGARENGGIFFHSNTWVIIAYAMLGRAEDAFKCYFATLPNRRNEIADLCLTEPYVYSQTMIAPPHSRAWECVNSWLTGTASWMYYAATQYILGLRPSYKGFCIDPQIPADWNGFKAVRVCRNTKCDITVSNGNGELYVNGEKIDGRVIPWDYFKGQDLSIELK